MRINIINDDFKLNKQIINVPFRVYCENVMIMLYLAGDATMVPTNTILSYRPTYFQYSDKPDPIVCPHFVFIQH